MALITDPKMGLRAAVRRTVAPPSQLAMGGMMAPPPPPPLSATSDPVLPPAPIPYPPVPYPSTPLSTPGSFSNPSEGFGAVESGGFSGSTDDDLVKFITENLMNRNQQQGG